MRLSVLTLEPLRIPFKVSFQHSSAARSATEAVLVTAQTSRGLKGLGEGCPRRYVTGETLASAQDFFAAHHYDFLEIGSLKGLKNWIDEHTAEIDRNPAAFCAVELALLDVIAQSSDQSIEALLTLPELSGEFRYTGVLGTKNPEHFKSQLQQYLRSGFNDFKIKIFGDLNVDQENMEIIRKYISKEICVRLDANNLWANSRQAVNYINRLDYSVFAIEEPLVPFDIKGCKEIFDQLKTPIILDESFIRKEMFNHIQQCPATWIINLRISKMGGLLRSLAVAEKAKELNIPIVIGAHVGETSILTRVALTVANSFRDIIVAQEGAFGTHLLEYDLIEPPLMFANKGIIKADRVPSALKRPIS